MHVLITGGAKGLGLACVQVALGYGAKVTVVDRDDLGLSRLPSSVVSIQADMAEPSDLAVAIDRLQASNPFDLIVMNAGINVTGPFETLPLEQQATVIAVNLTAPIQLTAALLQTGRISRGGRLVFVSSLSHFVGYPGASVYAGTKDGLTNFARSLRRPLQRSLGVRVQVVAPGPMDTEHARTHSPTPDDAGSRLSPAIVADTIWRRRSGFMIVPGIAATAASVFGRLFPTTASSKVRRTLFVELKARALAADDGSDLFYEQTTLQNVRGEKHQ